MLGTLQDRTLQDVIADRAPRFHAAGIARTTRLVQATRVAEEGALKMAAECEQMFRKLGFAETWELPRLDIQGEIGRLDLNEARMLCEEAYEGLVRSIGWKFQNSLEEASEANLVGKIEWFDNQDSFLRKGCRLSFFEQERQRTWTEIRERKIQHTHDLVDATRHRLPANAVKKPKRCVELIRAMPEWLRKSPCTYIVTGTQIKAAIETVEEKARPNEFVRLAKWLGQQTADAVDRSILSDPGLCVGDFCLFGWN